MNGFTRSDQSGTDQNDLAHASRTRRWVAHAPHAEIARPYQLDLIHEPRDEGQSRPLNLE